ncbi:hypothetical protein [Sphingomonas sp.]|uniref:hypothetical protein n=2 Tax=Sphingomonas TaxID=13687 RepID=UPI00286F4080|nr:hypothetical protein [Sphingomonas sp.]
MRAETTIRITGGRGRAFAGNAAHYARRSIMTAAPAPSGEAGIATKLASEVGTAVFDTVVGEAIGGPILDFLGLGSGTPDYTAYFNAISTQLDNLSSQINQDMSIIQQGIAEVKTALTTLTADLQDAELQAAMQAYVVQKNLVIQNYVTFADAIAGLASTDKNVQQQAIKTVFDLLTDTQSVDDVSAAMLNIHDQLFGTGEMKGIIAYQADLVNNAITKWATAKQPQPDPRPWNSGVKHVRYARVLTDFPQVLNGTLSATVMPNMKAMIAIQLQGLAFLISAWSGTSQEPQLGTHAANIYAQLQKMGQVYATVSDPAALDPYVQNLIDTIAQPLTTDFTDFWCVEVPAGQGDIAPKYASGPSWYSSAPFPYPINMAAWGNMVEPVWPSGISQGWPNEDPQAGSVGTSIIQLPIQWNSPTNLIVHYQPFAFSDASGNVAAVYYCSGPAPMFVCNTALIPLPHTFVSGPPADYAAYLAALAAVTAPTG